MSNLDQFVRGYVRCMLWAETDGSDDKRGEPLDRNYGPEDVSPLSMERIRADCALFLERAGEINEEDRVRSINPDEGTVYDYAGHDFWLTRAGHGAGFWDGDWTEKVGTKLTELSNTFRECEVYVAEGSVVCV